MELGTSAVVAKISACNVEHVQRVAGKDEVDVCETGSFKHQSTTMMFQNCGGIIMNIGQVAQNP